MRNIEQRIAAWRRSTAKACGHRAELLAELEEHLREEIERLRHSGAAEDDAFQMALAKLGLPSAIGAECDKLALNRRTWWPINIARVCAIGVVLVAGAMVLFRLDRIGLLLAAHVWSVIIGYSLMFAIGGLGISAVVAGRFGRLGPTERHALLRTMFHFANVSAVLTIIGAVLGMFWARENLGRYWAWDPKETGAIVIIFWALLISACYWIKPGAVVFLGVLGSAVTVGAWFGVNVKGFTSGSASPLLIAVIALHLVLAGVHIISRNKRQSAEIS